MAAPQCKFVAELMLSPARDGIYRFPKLEAARSREMVGLTQPEWLACRLVMVRFGRLYWANMNPHGDVAELADALDLGSSSFTGVQVRFLSSPLHLAATVAGLIEF